MENLRGAGALVTGASGGIGAHIARALAREGMNVALCARRQDALETLAGELRGLGGRAEVVAADLADLDGLESLVERTRDAIGAIDILINNAGVEQAGAYTRFTAQDLRGMIDLNLTAPALLTRHVLPGMLQRRRGHVVFMASLAGKSGPAYQGPYAATKAGLVALNQSLRAEHLGGPVGFSVICPGFVAGDGMYQRMLEGGVSSNRLLGHTTVQAVVASVLDAIRRNRPEVIESGSPVRPMLALAQLFPRAAERVTAWLGATDLFRRAAAKDGRA